MSTPLSLVPTAYRSTKREKPAFNQFNLATGRLINSFPPTTNYNSNAISLAALSPDSDLLATGSFNLTVRDTQNGKILQQYRPSGIVLWFNSVAFSPNGKLLAGSEEGATVSVWDVSAEKELYRSRIGRPRRSGTPGLVRDSALFPHPELRRRSSALMDCWWGPTISAGCVCGMQRRVRRCQPQLESDDFRIDSFAFSPDSKWLAAGGHEGNNSVERIREVSGREVRTLRAPGPPDSIAFSPNGTFLAAVTREFNPDKIFIVSWDVISGMQLFSQQQQANPAVRLTFGPDSQMLAATVADDGAKPSMNEIKLIDPRAGNVVQEKVVPEQSGFSSAVAYNPDGKILATGTFDGKLNFWDSATRRLIRTIEAHSKWINAVVFSSNGETVATASDDGTARIWKVKEVQ